jgi:hypothetical protein
MVHCLRTTFLGGNNWFVLGEKLLPFLQRVDGGFSYLLTENPFYPFALFKWGLICRVPYELVLASGLCSQDTGGVQ